MTTSHTPTPWKAFNMVNDEGNPLSADEIGLYVKNSFNKSIENGGSSERFLFIAAEDGTGPDLAHIGNGPLGKENAAFIVRACNSHSSQVALIERLLANYQQFVTDDKLDTHLVNCAYEALAKAKGTA